MLAFSLSYVVAGWMLLGAWGLGAEGLVGANAVNMVVRIVWTGRWVQDWWDGQREKETAEKEKDVLRFRVLSRETLPKARTVSMGVGAWGVLHVLQRQSFDGSSRDLVLALGVAGTAGLGM